MPSPVSATAWPDLPDLTAELLRLLPQVPPGRVCTYGDLARALGDVAASRWVATVLRDHQHTAPCHCHRVVRQDGAIRGYDGSSECETQRHLHAEGIPVEHGRVPMSRRWNQFRSCRPLAALADWQKSQVARINVTPRLKRIVRIGAVDVAYGADGSAVAAYVVLDATTRELLWQTTAEVPATFPYISGYLTFREVPPILAAIAQAQAADHLPDVLLVDGAGILHPRGCGLACWVVLASDLPTIGVTKSWLAGHHAPDVAPTGLPDKARPLAIGDRFAGAALCPRSGSQRLLFVSPGHGVQPQQAVTIVDAMLAARRLPEPIYWADRISRLGARSRQR